MFELYVVTDRSLSNGLSDSEVARLAYAGGADVVQLRMKDAGGRQMLEQAMAIKEYADAASGIFIVNDRVDIAVLSDADGVHLGQSDIPVAEARKILGDDKLLGSSVHSLVEARSAVEAGADYLSAGAVFRTATKQDAVQGIGLDLIFQIKESFDVPLIAIGGINLGNISDVIMAGADGAAVVSAAVSKSDISKAVHDLRDLVLKASFQKN
ncbi:MAG: thiamine phosphate synthase [Candidatus Methanoplasma sp.]|jgi:thiamine-phosphate pyrophosphorylase|nr:thiamine phosphate synthase [Candidatus Methanoplasma sp.]